MLPLVSLLFGGHIMQCSLAQNFQRRKIIQETLKWPYLRVLLHPLPNKVKEFSWIGLKLGIIISNAWESKYDNNKYNNNKSNQEKRKEKHAKTHISTKFNGIWVSSSFHSPFECNVVFIFCFKISHFLITKLRILILYFLYF